MQLKRLLFENSDDDLRMAASEVGIWGEQNWFVPLESIRLYTFYHAPATDRQWMAFSDVYEWAYITHQLDDFIRFFLETLPPTRKERFKIERGKPDDHILYLQDDLFLHYSHKEHLLIEMRNDSLILGEAHHKFWAYSWAVNVQMKGISTETYTLKKEEIDRLETHPNDLFNRGFFHQSSSEYFSTEELPENMPIWVFENLGKKHYFTKELFDLKTPIRKLIILHFSSPSNDIKVVPLPGLNAMIFQNGSDFVDFLREHGAGYSHKVIEDMRLETPHEGKEVLRILLEGDQEFCFNRSKKENYFDGIAYLEGHLWRFFFWDDQRYKPSLKEMVEADVKEVWHGLPIMSSAPKYVKKFVQVKHEKYEKEQREWKLGCLIIIGALALICWIIYWIFW